VRREQRDAVLLEELLILLEHAIEPGEELLSAVIGMDWDGIVSSRTQRETD